MLAAQRPSMQEGPHGWGRKGNDMYTQHTVPTTAANGFMTLTGLAVPELLLRSSKLT